jgi:predicted metal-dependent hydrolase
MAFGLRHLEWIDSQQARVGSSKIGADERHAIRARAVAELPPRLRELAARYQLDVSRISIRDQRTRWGSCGRDGHICLNWRLILMPDWVRDYVMLHELMHLKRLDHSRAYWALVADAHPDYQEARLWLREHGPSLR